MLMLDMKDLRPGMTLAAPVAHPRSGHHTLLKIGYKLTGPIIEKLRTLGVSYAWIQYPNLDFLDRFLGEHIPLARANMLQTIKKSFTSMSHNVSTRIPLADYVKSISELTLVLLAHPEHAIYAERLAQCGDELFAHSSNVSYLAIQVGLRMRGYIQDQRARLKAEHAREITNLGVGAMLHDLGKMFVDEELRNRHGIDSDIVDAEAYQEHVRLGYGLAQWNLEPTAVSVLLHHHQRYNGTGFPGRTTRATGGGSEPLFGNKIHIFSRIVAVANALDALMHQTKDSTPVQALYRLQTDEFKGWFDPIVLRAFLKVIPPFPLGHMVTLSSDQVAAVIGLNADQPCRPIVRTLDEVDPADINLAKHTDIQIVAHQNRPVERYMYELPLLPKAPVTKPAARPAEGSAIPVRQPRGRSVSDELSLEDAAAWQQISSPPPTPATPPKQTAPPQKQPATPDPRTFHPV